MFVYIFWSYPLSAAEPPPKPCGEPKALAILTFGAIVVAPPNGEAPPNGDGAGADPNPGPNCAAGAAACGCPGVFIANENDDNALC